MHLKTGEAHHEPRAEKVIVLSVIAQHVAHVLTEIALDALAEFLHCFIRQMPSASLARGWNGVILRFTSKFHDTSVTKSFTCWNVLKGWMLITSPGLKVSIRVMHISFGLPLTSAEHEPHFPALQFQRQAKSGACRA
jgi:hypothetical protein